MRTPHYGSFVLGPHPSGIALGDIELGDPFGESFGDPEMGFSLNPVEWVKDGVKAVANVAEKAVDAIDKVYVDATPQWLRKGVGTVVSLTPVGPAKALFDAGVNIADGKRIDQALWDAGSKLADNYKQAAPFVQLGLSFVPGVGQSLSAVIGSAIALAEGKTITDALIAGVASSLPGGPLVQRAVMMGASAATSLAQGKKIDEIGLAAIRSQVPEGAARVAFDTGLALAQGKKIQEAGIDAVSKLVPNNPVAQTAFAMTKTMLTNGGGGGGGGRVVAQAIGPNAIRMALPVQKAAPRPVARPVPAARPAPRPMARVMSAPVQAPAPEAPSHAVPIALGVAALAAAGGGTWWWMNEQKKQKKGSKRR